MALYERLCDAKEHPAAIAQLAIARAKLFDKRYLQAPYDPADLGSRIQGKLIISQLD